MGLISELQLAFAAAVSVTVYAIFSMRVTTVPLPVSKPTQFGNGDFDEAPALTPDLIVTAFLNPAFLSSAFRFVGRVAAGIMEATPCCSAVFLEGSRKVVGESIGIKAPATKVSRVSRKAATPSPSRPRIETGYRTKYIGPGGLSRGRAALRGN